MSEWYLYRDDFQGESSLGGNPRETEDSQKVVRMWFDSRVRYADEDIPDEQCQRLVAERILVRHLLGLVRLETKLLAKAASVSPFGPGTPSLAELMIPGVFVCMAFVPLAPLMPDGRPVLARLYCVTGLLKRYKLHLDGREELSAGKCSWFLAGVPADLIARGVQGRSWLLAAHLLAMVAERQDVKTARNLARNYIVTGDVSGGTIRSVEMLRKPELAKQFTNFKWIIPKENDMDIPKRKIEKPATLDEAYKLIESMQSVATQSLFNALHKADFAEAQVQYEKMGADIYALEKDTGLSTLEVVAQEIEQCRMDKSRSESERENRIGQLREIMMWLKQENAECSLMFYMLAQTGDDAALSASSQLYPINAVDENGWTAVDWAINSRNFEAAERLRSKGGRINKRWGANERLLKVFNKLFWDAGLNPELCENTSEDRDRLYRLGVTEEERKTVVEAIRSGLPPDGYVLTGKTIISVGGEGTLTASPFTLAIYRAEKEIVEEWVRAGVNNETGVAAFESNGNGMCDTPSGCLCAAMPCATAIRIIERIEKNLSERGKIPVVKPDGNEGVLQIADGDRRIEKLASIKKFLEQNGFLRDRPGECYVD